LDRISQGINCYIIYTHSRTETIGTTWYGSPSYKEYTLCQKNGIDSECVHPHENDPWIRASQALLDSNFSINFALGVANPEPLGEGDDIVPSWGALTGFGACNRLGREGAVSGRGSYNKDSGKLRGGGFSEGGEGFWSGLLLPLGRKSGEPMGEPDGHSSSCAS